VTREEKETMNIITNSQLAMSETNHQNLALNVHHTEFDKRRNIIHVRRAEVIINQSINLF